VECDRAFYHTKTPEMGYSETMDIVYSLENLEFEWNPSKAQSNYQKHGVTFEQAAEIFLDPFHVVGDASANQEQRDFAIGYTFLDEMLIVINIERRQKIRIISARLVTSKEQKMYEQGQSAF
jgi:uncharacterized protein